MVYDTPADIDIGEWSAQDKDDGAEVIVLDWGDDTIVVKRAAAVDTAYGVLHLAGEKSPEVDRSIDGWEMIRGLATVTVFAVWAWIVWNALTAWTA